MWPLGCAAALCLGACSGADPAGESTSAPAATASAPVEAATPTADESAPPADEPASAVSAAALCEYLAGQLPALREIGSEVGAMANLTVNLYSWYEAQGAVPSGVEIDALVEQECPEVSAEVLTLAGIESFAAL